MSPVYRLGEKAPVIPVGTSRTGPGVRTASEHEQVEHANHLQDVEQACGDAMELATALLKASKQEGCQDTRSLVDLSEQASVLAADIHRYYEANEDLGEVLG